MNPIQGIIWLAILVLPVLVGVWFMSRSLRRSGGLRGAGGRSPADMGKSQARLHDGTPGAERPTTTFRDVAGIDEARAELEEVVDFLREPQRYARLGGRMPAGVLLVGDPGTGKTLMARAVAGEAQRPFLSANASEFVEMVVGVGAARVRDLFENARKLAPAIVFIDEIDAIGRRRGSGTAMAGHNEQEQTLNQILAEMDGFDSRQGVIVIGATNRVDVLDRALLRPGRFDRQVHVQLPDRAGRVAILRIHTRHVPLADDVDLDAIAALTTGLVGAELRNLINEAALLASRRNLSAVGKAELDESLTKVMLGAERRLGMTDEERLRIAYHEAGHALVGLLVPMGDGVRAVSIVPRGQSLGATLQQPMDERFTRREEWLRGRITTALGGRVAEQLVFGEVSTGAEDDLRVLTNLARSMVVRWGMSPALGPVDYHSEEQRTLNGEPRLSAETLRAIDEETRRIIATCEEASLVLLADHRPELDTLAQALLHEETLDADGIKKVIGEPLRARELPVRRPTVNRDGAERRSYRLATHTRRGRIDGTRTP